MVLLLGAGLSCKKNSHFLLMKMTVYSFLADEIAMRKA